MSNLSVCIATYRGGRRLERLLENLSACTYKDAEVIVCDDASPPDDRDTIRELCRRFNCAGHIRNINNLGCAASYNNLVDEAKTENIILLDDDVLIPVDFLEHVYHILKNNPHIGVAGWKSEKITEDAAEALIRSINTFRASKFNSAISPPESIYGP